MTGLEWFIFFGVASSCIALIGYFKGMVTAQKKWFLASHLTCLLGILLVLLLSGELQHIGAFLVIIGVFLFVSNFIVNVIFYRKSRG